MTHPPATCELCGGTGLYSPSELPCPKGCSAEDIVDRLRYQAKVGLIGLPNNFRTVSYSEAANYITNMQQYISELEQREKDARVKALEEAAHAGYVACAETRHVTLGDKVAAAIRALKDEVR